jgi:hypothetical protein
MKLNELHQPKTVLLKKALKENFETSIDTSKLDMKTTRSMLTKVKGLISESRVADGAQHNYRNSAYMKLVMMEQLLGDHYAQLRVEPRIVLENEEVQQAEVVLAAQSMVDAVQKMIEQVSKMNAEELPAVVDGISGQFGTSESQSFNDTVAQTLTTLQASLTTAKTELSGSLGQITGEETADAFSGDEMSADVDAEMGDEELDLDMEEPADDMADMPELPEPEENLGGAGRELR